MDAQHQVMASCSSSSTGEIPCRSVVKRRRTKLHRALPPLPSAAASTASSSTSSEEESGFNDEKEEDMANCLILLAQGVGGARKFATRRFTEAATTAGGRAGFYVYECKTCNRCFSSFQALGGHRASHKKLKMVAAMPPEEKKLAHADECDLQMSMNSCFNPMASARTGAATGGKAKVHECSICGTEFSSGQALGGHMRRHRTAIPPDELKKEKNVLSLDLNLPAPADEEIPFSIAGKSPVFPPTVSAALVGCHY